MTFRSDKLPPPPRTSEPLELYRWNYRVFELLNGIVQTLASFVATTPSGSITGTDAQTVITQIIALLENHDGRHANGGGDELSVAGLSGLLADPQTPLAHKTSHQNGGADEISIAGLSGEAADDQPPKSHGNEKHSSTFATETYADAAAADEVTAHEGESDPHTGYQKESEKDAANGYAGLNASSRAIKGVDTTDDVIVDLATKGLVLKDTQGTPHYWRLTYSGGAVWTDLGTVKP